MSHNQNQERTKMEQKKERHLPKEIKDELLKMIGEEIDSITITNNGKPCTLYELEGKVLDIGKRNNQQILEKLAAFESKEYGKKKHARTARED